MMKNDKRRAAQLAVLAPAIAALMGCAPHDAPKPTFTTPARLSRETTNYEYAAPGAGAASGAAGLQGNTHFGNTHFGR